MPPRCRCGTVPGTAGSRTRGSVSRAAGAENLPGGIYKGAQLGRFGRVAREIEEEARLLDAGGRKNLTQTALSEVVADQRFEEIRDADPIERQLPRVQCIGHADRAMHRDRNVLRVLFEVPSIDGL